MKFLALLGQQLKDDAVIDVLECMDMTVVYDFDRLRENIPDRYWAAAKNDGFQFGFDQKQILNLIFIYVIADEGFAPFNTDECDVPFFNSLAEIEAYGAKGDVRVTKGTSSLLGIQRQWIRLEYDRHSTHYEFRNDKLARVSVQSVQ